MSFNFLCSALVQRTREARNMVGWYQFNIAEVHCVKARILCFPFTADLEGELNHKDKGQCTHLPQA